MAEPGEEEALMKEIIYITAILAVLLSLSGFALAGMLLMSDDFKEYKLGSDAFPMWVPHSGQWEVTREGFQGTDCEGNFIALGASSGSKQWSNYSVSLKLRLVSRGSDWRDGPWIGFRHRDNNNSYTLAFYDRIAALHKVSRGIMTGDETAMTQTNMTIKDDRWHNLRIIARDQQIAVILDGNTIMRVLDDDWNESPPVDSGNITLCARKYGGSAGSTVVVFKDVNVEATEDVPDFMKYTIEDARRAAGGLAPGNAKVSMLDFIKSRRDGRLTQVPRKVLAFYYTWYGRPENHGNWVHWGEVNPEEHDISASTHYPAIGAYDSHDPETIDHHIQLAKEHGIDAFICTWWGQGRFDDRAFVKVLDRAEKKDFKVTIYWETAPGKGEMKLVQAVNDLVYVLEEYGSSPAFLKVDGKPVIFVYGRVMGQVAMNEWPQIITMTQKRYGKDFLLIADGYKEGYARIFDGIHTYNICGWVKGKTVNELGEFSKQSFAGAVDLARRNGRLSCITIIPGYDDTKIRTPGINAERLDGETYKVLWQEAIAADPDWVLITSWNEWHEGSEIEPSWEHGDKYIKMTGEYANRFKKALRSASATRQRQGISQEKARELQELFKNKTIAILPDFSSEAPFWLADTGVDLKELTWEEVLDPDQLNVKNYPVLVYASGERYTQSLLEEGDVDAAILRYLGEGGLLMTLPSQPFPFFYNEAGESVLSARKLGLPVKGAWETPPSGVELTFEVDNEALMNLPLSIPFPETGDLRWRPGTGDDLHEDDIYLPLARLRDAKGNDYGDGIIYVEHRASPPVKGKNIYAWMRMLDIFNTDDFLYALFHLAGEVMTQNID
jgi:hypothetical protein